MDNEVARNVRRLAELLLEAVEKLGAVATTVNQLVELVGLHEEALQTLEERVTSLEHHHNLNS